MLASCYLPGPASESAALTPFPPPGCGQTSKTAYRSALPPLQNESASLGFHFGLRENEVSVIPIENTCLATGIKRQQPRFRSCCLCVGIVLFSRSVARQVFSPPTSLTSVFGMGTGGPSSSLAPTSSESASLTPFPPVALRLPSKTAHRSALPPLQNETLVSFWHGGCRPPRFQTQGLKSGRTTTPVPK